MSNENGMVKCCVCGRIEKRKHALNTKRAKWLWWWKGRGGYYCYSSECQKVAMDGMRELRKRA